MPSLRVVQTDHHQLGDILLFGEGWAADSVRLTIDGKDFLRISAFTGAVSGSTVQPLDGRFLLLAWLPASTAGDVSIEAHETAGQGRTETAALRLPPASAWPLPPPSRDPAAQLRDFDQQRGRDRNPGSRLQAVRDVQAARSKQQRGPRGAANWTPVGPQTIWNGPTLATFPPSPRAGETSPVSGRVTALAVDPISPSTIYAGAAQGGIWKSTDRGVTWDAKSDFEVSLAIGSLVAVKRTVNGVDSTRLYVGTGEANFVDDSYYGAGLLRSDDGGKTWTSLAASVFERCHIGAIVVDPGNGNADHLFTGSNKGLAESTDSGASWTFHPLGGTQSYTVTGLALATINNKLQVLAGIYGGVVGVFDVSSSSWTTLTREGAGVTTRITLAAAPADPQTVYAAFGSPGPIYGIYKTPDFGNAWQQVSVPQGTKNSTYGLTLAVDPGDSNIVMLGEIGMWRSVNGCNNWTDVSLGTSATANVALHVDQHAIAFDSTTTPSRVYVGNDGGVWRSDDGCANWVSLNKGMQITQFNSMDTSGPAVMLAGSQDNGSMGWFGNPAFTLLVPGDGGQVYAAHQELTSNWLAARAKDQSLGLYASADFGLNWNFMGMNGLDPKTETFGFYPPFAVLPDGYCIGGQHLFYQTQPGQPWATISPDLTKYWSYTTPGYISTIRLLKPPPHDPRASRLLVGTSNGLLWTVDQVLGQPVWHAQGNYLRDNTNPVRAISPEGLFIPGFGRSREFVVTGGFSGPHVFRNDGEWNFVVVPTPIPDTNPVNCIEMPFTRGARNQSQVFLGCDVGIYRSDDGAQTWTEWDEGLPNVAVVGLRWTDDGSSGGILRAVTHGRGIWERPVDAVSTPAVDLYMRHSDLDDGRLPVSTAAIPVARRPLRVVGGYGYEHQGLITPDVKLDTPFLSNNTWVYQFSDPAIDFAQFARFDVLPFGGRPISDCYPVVGAPVRIYVQLRNRGHRTAGTVTARVFLCNTRVSPLPNLPSDFWTAFPNSDPSPSANWSAIGPAQTVSNLRQGIPQILKFDWTPSALSGPATRGQALLVVITSSDDPVSETSLSPSDFVPRNKHTVIKPVDLSSVPNVSNTSPGPFRSPVSGGVIVSLSGSGFTGGRVVFEGEWYGGLVTIDGITTGPLTDPWGAGPTDSAVTALVPHTIFTPGRPGSVFVRSLGGDSNKLTFTWDTV